MTVASPVCQRWPSILHLDAAFRSGILRLSMFDELEFDTCSPFGSIPDRSSALVPYPIDRRLTLLRHVRSAEVSRDDVALALAAMVGDAFDQG